MQELSLLLLILFTFYQINVMRIYRLVFFSLFVTAGLMIVSCGKEGPAGPQGPAGDPANYELGEYLVESEDFSFNYAEISVDIITEDIMNEGIVLVYVMDEFGYWNNVPSAFTPIIGYSYVWTEENGGRLGIDHDPDVTPTDYTVRVVTMFQRTHQELPDEDIVEDYESLLEHLSIQ